MSEQIFKTYQACPIEIPDDMKESGVRVEHDRKYDFDYLSAEDYDTLAAADKNVTTIGWIRYHTVKPDKKCDMVVSTHKNDDGSVDHFNFRFHAFKEDDDRNNGFRYITEYVHIGDNRYVEVTTIPFFFILLLFATLLACVGILRGCPTQGNVPADAGPSLAIESGVPISEEYREPILETIDIPGYADMTLDASYRDINLKNPEGNTVYFVYTLSENDEVVYETNAIIPGEMVKVDAYELLGTGEHDLMISIATYDVETEGSCNGASQEIKVTVK